MSDIDARWPLAALPVDRGRLAQTGVRATFYDLAACIGVEPCMLYPTQADQDMWDARFITTILHGVSSLPARERDTVMQVLAAMGTERLVAVLLRAVLVGTAIKQRCAVVCTCGGRA